LFITTAVPSVASTQPIKKAKITTNEPTLVKASAIALTDDAKPKQISVRVKRSAGVSANWRQVAILLFFFKFLL
jgi:hypothetical protein